MRPLEKRLAKLERMRGIDPDRKNRFGLMLKGFLDSCSPDTRSPKEQAESEVRVKRFADFLLENIKNIKLACQNETA